VANARLIGTMASTDINRAVEEKIRYLVRCLRHKLKHIAEDGIDVYGLEELFHDALKLDALIQ
jgi:hypothetical protein